MKNIIKSNPITNPSEETLDVIGTMIKNCTNVVSFEEAFGEKLHKEEETQ